MTQRVLVAGGAGFVGRHVVAKLSAAGHDVVVLTRARERARELLLLPTVRVVEADPFDAAVLARWTHGASGALQTKAFPDQPHQRHGMKRSRMPGAT